MSNFDLLEWCKYLKIPIKNVLSRDQKVPHNHKLSLFIYNLEPSYMSGSHWPFMLKTMSSIILIALVCHHFKRYWIMLKGGT